MTERPELRLVDPETGELHDACPACADKDDEITGHLSTIQSQSRTIGRLERKLSAETNVEEHPKGREIVELIERWKEATGHPRAKVSKDRVDVIKARLKDGYTFEQMQLAIDGIGACPYVVNGQRVPEGKPSQRHDALSIALKGGENLERFANLGASARPNS